MIADRKKDSAKSFGSACMNIVVESARHTTMTSKKAGKMRKVLRVAKSRMLNRLFSMSSAI